MGGSRNGQTAAMGRDEHNGLLSRMRPNAPAAASLWPELVVGGWDRVHNHAVSPDGRQVAFFLDRAGASDLWVITLDEPWFPRQLTLGRAHVNWWEDEPPTWSPDSQWLVFGAYEDNVSHLNVVSAAGGQVRRLTNLVDDAAEPVFSPDGRHIVFSTHHGEASQIARIAFEGGWVTGLTFSEEECTTPVWSPDGRMIVFSASPVHKRRQNDLHALDLAGSRGHMRLTPDDDDVECWSPAFSPSGNVIAMLSNRTGWDEVWTMRPDGGDLRQLSHFCADVEEFSWSPDGAQLLALVNRAGYDTLATLDAGTGEHRVLALQAGNYSGPQFVRGQNAIVAGFDAPDTPPELRLIDLAGGQARALTHTSAAAWRQCEFVIPEHIEFESDDAIVPGFLYRPQRDSYSGAQPAGIVYPHGGPNVHYDFSWDPFRQYFAAKGYAILCPNYRGSTGYGRAFKDANRLKWGVVDLADCFAAARALCSQGQANPRRLATWGQSYGGYLSLLALCKDAAHVFRCGVALYGDSHLITSWANGDHSGRLDVEWQMGDPGENADLYERASPLNFVNDIRAPLLVMHGEQDQRVAYSESVQLIQALQRAGKTYEFLSFPEEAHGFATAANALTALSRIERFIDWWLM